MKNRHGLRSARGLLALGLGAAAALSALALPAAATAEPVPVKVMTRNLYLGAVLDPVIAAPDAPSLFIAGGTVFRQVQRTNFPGRAALLAEEIERREPHVVGLQEVAHWQRDINGAPDGPITPANETVYDFLKLLRSELAERGLRYKTAVVQNEFTAELPVDNSLPPDGVPEFDGKLTMRDILLVKRRLRTSNATSANFSPANTLQFPTPLGIPLFAHRGWTAVDVMKGGVRFRVVNTHLEAFDDDVRLGQAEELAARPELDGPRVILLGDLNSDPEGGSPEAYDVFTGDGFADRGVDVDTCCHDDELRNPPPATFDSRIDHVLSRGRVAPMGAALLGAGDAAFGELGIWPSDHGGVFARLRVR